MQSSRQTCAGWIYPPGNLGLVLWFIFISLMVSSGPVAAVSLVPQTCDLPAYGNWNNGMKPDGYGVELQLEWVKQGHRIAPWLPLPLPHQTLQVSRYESALREYRARRLPITFTGTQWEFLLSEQPYLRIKDDTNPNVLGRSGINERRLSPFGSEKYWYEVGKSWTDREMFRQLATIYPDPPQVILLSNNEHPLLGWRELERDRRFVSRYGSKLTDDQKRELAVSLWETLYQALHRGMREGLAGTPWKDRVRLVGFLANGSMNMGRDSGWMFERLHTPDRIDPYSRFWDGSSYDIYYNSEETLLRSAPFRAMNSVFMVEENRRTKRDYYAELSIWDGHTYDRKDWRQRQEKRQPGSSLSAFVALGTLGMWLLKPEVVREFRFYDESYRNNREYTQGIMARIDAVSSDPVLKSFWCKGELVKNARVAHPYQHSVPAKYQAESRWYFLDVEPASASPARANPDRYAAAIALRKGRVPDRSWLVYGYGVGSAGTSARLMLPDFGMIEVTLSAAGDYYLVSEKTRSVKPLHAGGASGMQ